ncbi:MAG: hypothetical protein ACLFUB_03695 [Cyclobacteriaceae bacterium]
MENEAASSSGHKLGQIIGDWYEEYFALPILQRIADELDLYLDTRFKKRNCRREKIIWKDVDGNNVDYDFVMELGGSEDEKGVPVAFFETFWRRGSRHSKDKARDDTGKLLPMKSTFPTARILGLVSAGDFTGPARELVISRGVELFYVEKQKIVDAWLQHGLTIDYPDKSSEEEKAKIAEKVITRIRKDEELLSKISSTLVEIIKPKSIDSFCMRLIGKIGASPQKYLIQIQSKSKPILFEKYSDVDEFLGNSEPNVVKFEKTQYYGYHVDFTDGDEFFRENLTWIELKKLHEDLKQLVRKVE